jgi:hypothetical protein
MITDYSTFFRIRFVGLPIHESRCSLFLLGIGVILLSESVSTFDFQPEDDFLYM